MTELFANYHTHTFRCGHAEGQDREYIESAIKAGFKVLGFSDHTPMPFPSGHKSGHRIPLDLAKDYFNSLLKLKEEYKKDIEIHIGVETEFYPETFDLYCDYMSNFPCEYMILGQHFINNEERGALSFAPTDDENILKEFYDNLIEAVKTKRFLYVAHPDVINFTGNKEIFLREAERFLNEIKEYNIPLEINRLGLTDGRHYPKKEFFQLVAKYQNPVVIGMDSHSPGSLSNTEGINKAIGFAKETGVNLVKNNILKLGE